MTEPLCCCFRLVDDVELACISKVRSTELGAIPHDHSQSKSNIDLVSSNFFLQLSDRRLPPDPAGLVKLQPIATSP